LALSRRATVVRELRLADADAWAAMRHALWPTSSLAELRSELPDLVSRHDFAAFGAALPSGRLIGFLEVGTRSVAEGAATSPVGYIEGMWVEVGVRRRGIARALVEAAIDWSLSRGYRELGSDAEIENTLSHAVHARLGFTETERLVTFLMDLRQRPRR
jgi:aminoglycoside 6'-N-acetyltransferase I